MDITHCNISPLMGKFWISPVVTLARQSITKKTKWTWTIKTWKIIYPPPELYYTSVQFFKLLTFAKPLSRFGQTSNKLHASKRGKQFCTNQVWPLNDQAPPLNDQLSATTEWLVKLHWWMVRLAPLLNDRFSTDQLTPRCNTINTLMGHVVSRCDLPDRAGRVPPDINVYAIFNFLTSSLVLDLFFWYEIVRN